MSEMTGTSTGEVIFRTGTNGGAMGGADRLLGIFPGCQGGFLGVQSWGDKPIFGGSFLNMIFSPEGKPFLCSKMVDGLLSRNMRYEDYVSAFGIGGLPQVSSQEIYGTPSHGGDGPPIQMAHFDGNILGELGRARVGGGADIEGPSISI